MGLNKLIVAAERGGSVLKKYFWKELKTIQKTTVADIFTRADLESEKVILSTLKKYFPNHNIKSEEYGYIDKKSNDTLIVDPLDGTNNFILGLPIFSVAIALMKDKQMISSVVHNPILNQTFYAEKRKGSYLNGTKLNINKETDIKKSTISLMMPYLAKDEDETKIRKNLDSLMVKRVLSLWSPQLSFCLLAAGKIEAILNFGIKDYDYLAGKLIVEEANARITDFEGKEIRNDSMNSFLASNGTRIHNQLLKILKR